MARIQISITILIISSLILIADGRILSEKREKITKFTVYVHDVRGEGPNTTVVEVARANITSTSPTSFGLVTVADSLMTAGPDVNSLKLGRAQGLAVNSGLEEMSFTLGGVFLFTAGEYSGSTLNTFGWKKLTNDYQEVPIVGGTGAFRLARGYTLSNLYYDPAMDYYRFKFDMYVVCMKD